MQACFNGRTKLWAVTLIVLWWTAFATGQDLAPRAYVITPLHTNAITLTWSFYSGGLNFNGTVPITGATGTYHVPVFSYYHSLNFKQVRTCRIYIPYRRVVHTVSE